MENVQQTDVNAIEIGCFAPDAKNVFLTGTFNDWSETSIPIAKGNDGNWNVHVDLSPGRYEYRFLVDGKSCCRPGCEDKPHLGCKECVPNSSGTMNRVIEVGKQGEG